MLKAYKYRLYPTIEQQEQLAKAFGCVRFVYNLGLETKVAAWTSAKKKYSCIDLSNEMKQLKDTEAPWLSDCPSQALQSSLRHGRRWWDPAWAEWEPDPSWPTPAYA